MSKRYGALLEAIWGSFGVPELHLPLEVDGDFVSLALGEGCEPHVEVIAPVWCVCVCVCVRARARDCVCVRDWL